MRYFASDIILQDLSQLAEQLVDVMFLDDQRRRQRDDVAGGADQKALLVGLQEGGKGALGRFAGDGIGGRMRGGPWLTARNLPSSR